MRMPGFTAEAALYRENEFYQSEPAATINQTSGSVDVVQPAGPISYLICMAACDRGSRCRDICWIYLFPPFP